MRHVLRVSCHFKTRSRGGVIIHEKRILCSFPTMRCIQTFTTCYQDLQDAFARHAPISRCVRKTRQDAKTYKTPRPTRRIRTARSHFKTRSKNTTRRQDLQDAFERHAPFSRHVLKARQDVFAHNKTPRPTRRICMARSHFMTRLEKQDKTHTNTSTPTLDAFERHAPFSRRLRKNKTRLIRA